jgi:tetratricopeptide (TPR) repeat protein
VRIQFVAVVALFAFAAPAQAEWWEAKTDHFIVYSESTQADASKFAEELERFDMALRSVQNIKLSAADSDSKRLTVFRFGQTDDIGRLAGVSGVAGFYIPNLGGSVAFTPARQGLRRAGELIGNRRDSRTNLDPKSVLLHEYAHHFMYQHFSAAYPRWYSEGFAETAATIVLNDDGSFHIGNPPQYRSDDLFNNMITVNASDMLASTDKPDGLDYYNHYTVGWLLNHYLSFDPTRQGQLTAYLRAINNGTDAPEAARKAFGDLRKLDRELIRYRNSGKLGGADVKPVNYAPPRVTVRRLGPDEEAVIRVKARSKSGVDRKEAGDVARDAASVAAKFPNSLPVQLELAEAEIDLAEYRPERLVQAEAAADRALAIDPDSIDAMIFKGRTYLERGRKDPKLLETAREWFVKAHDVDPLHAAPYYYSYMTYFYAGGAIPESALIGLERAFEYAPYDHQLRVVLGRQLLAEKKGELARSVLMPLAIAPHASKGSKAMYDVVQLIAANKVDEAYKKLASEMDEQERKRKAGEDD